jgi:hypothetical protein
MSERDHAPNARPPDANGKPDVCLFAVYAPNGGIPTHTRRYLAHLAECGFALHVACAGVTKIGSDEAAFLASIGAVGHPRENAGLDFGGWSALLAAGCATGAPRVLLANDSVFGPYGDLRPIIARMNARGLDAWGLVASHERVRHLQSWFVSLTAAALATPAVRRVFAQDFTAMTKEEIILHGELGLGVALRAEHLVVDAVWTHTARLRRLMPVNPTHFDWRSMLLSGKVPFLKAELLRDNPANIGWIGDWRDVLRRCPHGDPAEIDAAFAKPWRVPLTRGKPIRLLLNALLTRDHRAAALALARGGWNDTDGPGM